MNIFLCSDTLKSSKINFVAFLIQLLFEIHTNEDLRDRGSRYFLNKEILHNINYTELRLHLMKVSKYC